MTNLAESQLQVAGFVHVYVANPDAEAPDLWAYEFGDGTTLDAEGWTWVGDTSSENLPTFARDGGETTSLRTADRLSAASSTSASTNTVEFHTLTTNETAVRLAFPGSTYDSAKGAWDLTLGKTENKAVLLIIEGGGVVSGFLIRKCAVSGSLPALSIDNFTEFTLTGTILSPDSGKAMVSALVARQVTGKALGKPTVTKIEPTSGKAGTQATVTGTNFGGVRTVTIGGKSAQFTYRTGTQLLVTVPAGLATSAQKVVVTNAQGSSTDNIEFTVQGG